LLASYHEGKLIAAQYAYLGRDPHLHGERLADAFARGAKSVDGVKVLYTGLASTPEMLVFCAPNW
jgi:phosphomannomutase